MKTVSRIYTSDIDTIPPIIEQGIDFEQLEHENEGGYEDWAKVVWNACEKEGMFNDSDLLSGVLCIYVKGES